MNKERIVEELRRYLGERTDSDKEDDFKNTFNKIDALNTLKKITNEEWGLLYDSMFELQDLILDIIADYIMQTPKGANNVKL